MTFDWWTLGFQTINVFVLIVALGYFFWTPTAAIIEKRRVTARDMLAAGERSQANAAAAAAEIQRTRAGFSHEREIIMVAANAAAKEARDALLKQAGIDADALAAAAAVTAEASKAAAITTWGERSSRLAVEIAGRLAARLDGQAVRAAFLDWLLESIAALPAATRQAIARDYTALDAITAAPLAMEDQEHCRALLWEAFGGRPPITFKADPSLIAGLELHGPHLIVSSNWRANLDQVLAELIHDDRR